MTPCLGLMTRWIFAFVSILLSVGFSRTLWNGFGTGSAHFLVVGPVRGLGQAKGVPSGMTWHPSRGPLSIPWWARCGVRVRRMVSRPAWRGV
jgi:hypothetical protein